MDKSTFKEIFNNIKKNGTKNGNTYFLGDGYSDDYCQEYSTGKCIKTKKYGKWELYNDFFEGEKIHKMI